MNTKRFVVLSPFIFTIVSFLSAVAFDDLKPGWVAAWFFLLSVLTGIIAASIGIYLLSKLVDRNCK